MKIYKSAYLFALPLLMFSCEPVAFDTTDDEPVFTSEITLGGDTFSFAAGVDDYVMNTETFSLVDYLNYSGTLEHKDAATSNPLFGINIRLSEKVRNTESPDHFDSFRVGEYPFLTIDNSVLPSPEVKFNVNYSGTGMNVIYNWDYGDDEFVEFRTPIHAYESTAETYIAKVRATDDNQCVASDQQIVSFDNRADCNSSIEIISIIDNSAVLEASSTGSVPMNYQWFDGSSESDLSIDIADTNDNQEFCVTVTDATGCSSVNCVGIIINEGTINNCVATMTESNFPKIQGAIQFDGVEVFWNDKLPGSQRTELSSLEKVQDNDAYFKIISFEEFERNDQGQRTVKLEYELKCTMYETLGTGPIPIEAKGTMAVAIPD